MIFYHREERRRAVYIPSTVQYLVWSDPHNEYAGFPVADLPGVNHGEVNTAGRFAAVVVYSFDDTFNDLAR